MTMTHSAFVFDHAAFKAELEPTLVRALESGDTLILMAWIESNRKLLTDPYEGKRLTEHWELEYKGRSVQEYGDIALTKFYNPIESIGLDDDWQQIGEELESLGLKEAILLGTPVGPQDNLFDPGGIGSYFQSQGTVRANLLKVETLLRLPDLQPRTHVEAVRNMLRTAALRSKGLYVTF